jgi:hypothetical protein
VIDRASSRGHPRLHIPIEGAGFIDRAAAPEDDFGGFGGKLPAGLGGAGLDDDRPALDRPRNVQRATHRQILTLMAKDVHLLRIEEDAARLVVPPRIVCPAIPKTGDDSLELARPPVAFIMLDMLGQPEIGRRIGIGGGDDIPSGAAIADVVERGEPAGEMVGFVEGRRCSISTSI